MNTREINILIVLVLAAFSIGIFAGAMLEQKPAIKEAGDLPYMDIGVQTSAPSNSDYKPSPIVLKKDWGWKRFFN